MKVSLVHADRPSTTDGMVEQVRIHLDDGLVLTIGAHTTSDDLELVLAGRRNHRLMLRPLAADVLRLGAEPTS